jgi:hypothetical protein
MNNENSEEVNNMIRVKQIMERIPDDEQSIEYKGIIQLICKFLDDNCKHKFIEDTIDISPDKSMQISYCEYCVNFH